MKYCINCKHCGALSFSADGSDLTRCMREGEFRPGVSPTTGKTYCEVIRVYTEIERNSTQEHACGLEAVFFEPKV